VKREKFYYKDKIHAWWRTVNDELNQNKAVQTGLFSKPIEFDGFKIGFVELLPDAEKLDGVAVTQPYVLYRYYTK
jgi:hypothetical protein